MQKIDLSELNLPEKEEKILSSAIKLFSEKGFDASTSKEIAKEAGVAEGTIFKYFKTKKHILTSILVNLLHLLSEKFIIKGIKDILFDNKDNDIKSILKKIIYDRIQTANKLYPMVQIIFIQALFHEEIRIALHDKIFKKAYKIFEDFYLDLVKKNIARSDISPDFAFRSVISNIIAFIAEKKLFCIDFNESVIEKEIDCVIDIILNGLSQSKN